MKEIVVISGKGGTGKTSLTGAFASLAENAVLADCDVDAADLHLLLQPKVRQRTDFYSGHQARVRQADCVGCGACLAYCRFAAVKMDPPRGPFHIEPTACEGCGVCVQFCPVKAIDFNDSLCGEWYISETRHGPMVHARLGIGAENSGRLVSLVRSEARKLAEEENRALVLVDGPPGVGCPVIASITGADAVLVVTEPTLSGKHDLNRVLDLAAHFSIPANVCVNKWDINPDMADSIEDEAGQRGATILGRVSYSPEMTQAQIAGQTIPEYSDGQLTREITAIWRALWTKM
ncbi:MAG: ATP-binding protein [Lentisphaeria bacterium]|nr:ATP-binding protein [Lentisphaeria bacterium]